ncbi:MAG: HNH endonuclease signature motif containing protein, partial [Clostridium saudiense]|nr:HNH endonuclease signature motif containing protein [Clostridium saudiense]
IAYRSKGKEKRKSIPVETRKIIYKQSGGRCAICGKQIDFNEMELDHINPVSLGGNSNQSNLQCCCVSCNRMKGNLPPEEFNTKTISIFMWQMDKRYHSKFSWRMANKIINRMVL